MKTDKISFGQTYLKPSIFKNLAPHNFQKVESIIPFGEIYPADIYIGADKSGDIVLDILHSTMGKFLYFSGEVPKTALNAGILQVMDSTERINRKMSGYKLPVYSIKIKDLDHFSIPKLQYTINEKLVYYYDKMIDRRFFH